MIKYIFLFCMLFNCSLSYWSQGWQWYDNNQEIEPFLLDDKTINQSQESYIEKLKQFQEIYKEAHAKSIITRNTDDVAYAMYLRKVMLQYSQEYGEAFEEALIKYPSLSSTIVHPKQTYALKIAEKIEKKNIIDAIKIYAKNYGFFYFYEGKNEYSQAMADTLGSFCKENNISLIGISLDGIQSKAISKHIQENGQIEQWGIKSIPALVLYNDKERNIEIFSYEFMAINQIEKRFLKLMLQKNKIRGEK